jgi:hypothetical protein
VHHPPPHAAAPPQARTHATSQAQQLASQAQLHAQASVQAAVQAEQLKQTLASERGGGGRARPLLPHSEPAPLWTEQRPAGTWAALGAAAWPAGAHPSALCTPG